MRTLLDTNAFIWANLAPAKLGAQLEVVADPINERLVSAVSAWEIASKWATGRLPIPEHPANFVPSCMRYLVATLVDIELAHALVVADLPLHRRDPFDRLLIAQARALDVPILTADRIFEAYDVDVLLIEAA